MRGQRWGYLHARERLWQMEVYRRATGGRLSEVFGPATLPADRRFLGLGLRRAAAGGVADCHTPGSQRARALRGRSQRRDGGNGTMEAAAGVPAARRDPRGVDARGLAGGRPAAGLAPRREPPRRARARAAHPRDGPAETNLLMGPMPPGAPAILDAAAPAPHAATAAPAPEVRRNRSDPGTRGSRRRPCLRGSSGSISRRVPATATAG